MKPKPAPSSSPPRSSDLRTPLAPDPRQILECRRAADTLREALLHAKINEMLIRHGRACVYAKSLPPSVVEDAANVYRVAGYRVDVRAPWIQVEMPSRTRKLNVS